MKKLISSGLFFLALATSNQAKDNPPITSIKIKSSCLIISIEHASSVSESIITIKNIPQLPNISVIMAPEDLNTDIRAAYGPIEVEHKIGNPYCTVTDHMANTQHTLALGQTITYDDLRECAYEKTAEPVAFQGAEPQATPYNPYSMLKDFLKAYFQYVKTKLFIFKQEL